MKQGGRLAFLELALATLLAFHGVVNAQYPMGYSAPKPSYGYSAPEPSYGYSAPEPSYGYSAPKPSYGYSAPEPSYGYSAPEPSYGYSAPKPSYGYSAPEPSYGYSAPKPSYGYSAPEPSYGYSAPKPSYGYSAPEPSYGYSAPKPSYGYSAPKPSYGYSAPEPSYGYRSYETKDIQVGYKPSNVSRQCGRLPAVHTQYGYGKERVDFGAYPWQVAIVQNNKYVCAGALISTFHVITSSRCVDDNPSYYRVRIGDYDLATDNYYEVYNNVEVPICKVHPFYNVPTHVQSQSSGYGEYQSNPSYGSYDVVILELEHEVNFDQLPQVEPLCLPELYTLTKTYVNRYSYSYSAPEYSSYGASYGASYGGYGGYGGPSGSSGPELHEAKVSSSGPNLQKNEEGSESDLKCIVLGYKNSPLEKVELKREVEQPKPSYQDQGYSSSSYGGGYGGYSSQPKAPTYEYKSYYEYSLTPRQALVKKTAVSQPQGYGGQPASSSQNDLWVAAYPYDVCHADLGSPIFCLVESRYEETALRPRYPDYNTPEYVPVVKPVDYGYSPSPAPSGYSYRQKRSAEYGYSAPKPSYGYQAPSYSAPSYQPAPEYYPSYPVRTAERLSLETRRAVLCGVVQSTTQCAQGSYSDEVTVESTPVKQIVSWIDNVIHTRPSCSSKPAYGYSSSY